MEGLDASIPIPLHFQPAAVAGESHTNQKNGLKFVQSADLPDLFLLL
jgi:hypothetical protein